MVAESATVAILGRRLALTSVAVGVALSIAKIWIGYAAGSTAVISDGIEAGADVVSSTIVFAGLTLATRPADKNHPYGHGRYETLAGLLVGAILFLTGVVIAVRSFASVGRVSQIQFFAVYPLIAAVAIKVVLSTFKFRVGRRLSSASLEADAWHDLTDLASTVVALTAVGLALLDPERFRMADQVGGMLIGCIIIFLSIRVVWQTTDLLVDTMPAEDLIREIRETAMTVPRVRGIEKCYARKTGLKYHVDLHLEVDPEMTVRESHEVATHVRIVVKEQLDWVADVLIHVEPSPAREPALPSSK